MSKINPILIFILLFIGTLVNGQNTNGQIPDEIKQFSDSLILMNIGEEHFERTTFICNQSMLTLDLALALNNCNSTFKEKKRKNKSSIQPKYFILKYKLLLIDTSHYEFEVRISKDRELMERIKLPSCFNTDLCNIKIGNAEAIDLAINSGLQKGLGIYNEGLIFDIELNSFLWRVKNHLTERPDTGELIIIDATSGERITEKDAQWSRSIIH